MTNLDLGATVPDQTEIPIQIRHSPNSSTGSNPNSACGGRVKITSWLGSISANPADLVYQGQEQHLTAPINMTLLVGERYALSLVPPFLF